MLCSAQIPDFKIPHSGTTTYSCKLISDKQDRRCCLENFEVIFSIRKLRENLQKTYILNR